MNQRIAASSNQLQQLLEQFCGQQGAELARVAKQLGNLFAGGGQLLIAGGGAFQPLAQLLASLFTYRLGFDRPALPAVALGSDPVLVATMMNTGQGEQHLLRHYQALNGEQQLLLLINDGSTSAALQILRDEVVENKQDVILLTAAGASDPLCRNELMTCIDLGTASAARQMELALFAGQLLCELVETELFGV